MGNRARLIKLLQDVRASYWFLPTVLVVVAILLAQSTVWIDRNPEYLPYELPVTFIDTQSEGARSTLAVIAQSIIGVTGVMFSMTIVAVSFASGNFGPRLVGNFMRDRGNQWSLGILIATFAYALLVLRTVQDNVEGGADTFVPQYSLLVALGLTFLSVFTLIYFVHHVPETINVSRISARLGTSLEGQIKQETEDHDEDGFVSQPERNPDHRIRSTVPGYIQTIDFDRLRDMATKYDWYVRVDAPVGSFLNMATDVFSIWSNEVLTEEQIKKAKSCFAVGLSRTENQNPTFVAEQLVEMVARALSPGVNDPYTAINCLNWLSSALTVACTHDGGLKKAPTGRIQNPVLTFERLFAATFPLCRQYVRPDRLVKNHALELLKTLLLNARAQDRSVIASEIDALENEETRI